MQAVGRFLDGPAPAALILEGPAGIGKTTVWRAGLETREPPPRPGDAPVGGRDGACDRRADRSPGRRVRRTRQLAAGAAAGGARRGAAARGRGGRRCAARNGLRRCAGAPAPRCGGVARPPCGRRPAVAGPGHVRGADLRAAPAGRDAGAAPRDRAHRGQRQPTHDPVPIAGISVSPPARRRVAVAAHRARARPASSAGRSCGGSPPSRQATPSSPSSSPGSHRRPVPPRTSSRRRRCPGRRTYRRLAETRVRVLPESTRTALGVVAALGEPRAAVLSRALSDEAALDAAFDAGVVEEQGDRVRFTHPLLAAGGASPVCPPGGGGPSTARSPIWPTRRRNARDTSPPRRPSHPPRSRRRSRRAPPARSRAGHPPRRPGCSRTRCASPRGRRRGAGAAARRAGNCREQAGDTVRALELFRRAVRASPPGRSGPWPASGRPPTCTRPRRSNVIELRVALEESGPTSRHEQTVTLNRDGPGDRRRRALRPAPPPAVGGSIGAADDEGLTGLGVVPGGPPRRADGAGSGRPALRPLRGWPTTGCSLHRPSARTRSWGRSTTGRTNSSPRRAAARRPRAGGGRRRRTRASPSSTAGSRSSRRRQQPPRPDLRGRGDRDPRPRS